MALMLDNLQVQISQAWSAVMPLGIPSVRVLSVSVLLLLALCAAEILSEKLGSTAAGLCALVSLILAGVEGYGLLACGMEIAGIGLCLIPLALPLALAIYVMAFNHAAIRETRERIAGLVILPWILFGIWLVVFGQCDAGLCPAAYPVLLLNVEGVNISLYVAAFVALVFPAASWKLICR